MTSGDDRLLAALRRRDSDRVRAERVRRRCHGVLARGRAPVIQTPARAARIWRVVESVVVGGFCVIYMCAVAVMAIQAHGAL